MVETTHIGLKINPIASRLPNDWGNIVNDEIRRLDAAITAVCTQEQQAKIRELIKPPAGERGVIT